MGHYHSTAVRLKIKSDAPKEFLDRLDLIYINRDPLAMIDRATILGEHDFFGMASAAYMPSKDGAKEKTEYGWLYTHIGSSKHCFIEEFKDFLNENFQYLAHDKGDIIRRVVYEDCPDEVVLVFGAGAVVKKKGHSFILDDGPVPGQIRIKHLHPYDSWDRHSDDKFDTHGYETLPWTMAELACVEDSRSNANKGRDDMGTYVGYAIRINIKPTLIKAIRNYFDCLFSRSDYVIKNGPAVMRPLANMVTGNSGDAYFPGWNWSFAKTSEDGVLRLESRSSMKYDSEALLYFKSMMNDIKEHLQLETGDILIRAIGEDSSVDQVVYFDGKDFVIGTGYVYSYDGTPARQNYNHPSNSVVEYGDYEKIASMEETQIPWNMSAIEALNKASKQAHDDCRDHNGFQ